MCERCASSARPPSGLAATAPRGYPTDWWRKADSRPAAGRPTAYAFGRGNAPGLTPKLRSAHLPTLAAPPTGGVSARAFGCSFGLQEHSADARDPAAPV